jgi:hypothetical protein
MIQTDREDLTMTEDPILKERRKEATDEGRQLLQRFRPNLTANDYDRKKHKLGELMYESQHWRVRKCHIGDKFVGYIIKQRRGSADWYGTINLSSVAKASTDELPKSMA